MSNVQPSMGRRVMFFVYGAGVYVLFLGTFLYAVGFVGNLLVPKSIDSGAAAPIGEAIAINVMLLGLFAVQHTIMARPRFKEWWTRIVPRPIERSTFVLATCVILVLTFWQWRPLPGVVWSVENPIGRAVLHGLFAGGFALVLYATFCIDHFDLFGLRQVVLYLRGKACTHPGFATPTLYRVVRNPLMLGFMIAFWSTPVMTQGHLLFAMVTTAYMFVGMTFEERDLLDMLGEDYRRYRAVTPMILPWPRRGTVSPPATVETN